MPAPGKV